MPEPGSIRASIEKALASGGGAPPPQPGAPTGGPETGGGATGSFGIGPSDIVKP